jgi:hypothetical protein
MAELSTYSESSAVETPIQAPAAPTEIVQTATPTLDTPVQDAAAPVVVDAPVTQTEANNSVFELALADEGTEDQSSTVAQPQFDWKEEIKKVDPNELVAALGLSPFALELDKHIKGGGQPIDYLQARAVDYNKFSDDALIKDSLRKENPTLSPRQIDLLFNRTYNAPEDASEEDMEFYKARLQADGEKIRQSRIAEQQKFKIADTPTPQKDEAYEQWKQYRQVQAQEEAQEIEKLRNHPDVKKLNDSKRVTISLGENVQPFNFDVNKPELINRVLMDDAAWRQLIAPQGEPDIAKQQLITLFAFNPQKFIQDIFNYGLQNGERKRVAEGQNAQIPGKVTHMEPNQTATYRTGTYGKQG